MASESLVLSTASKIAREFELTDLKLPLLLTLLFALFHFKNMRETGVFFPSLLFLKSL